MLGRPRVQGSCGLEGFRSWGVMGSGENGGKTGEEGLQSLVGNGEQCTVSSEGGRESLPSGFFDWGRPVISWGNGRKRKKGVKQLH
nr:hypothetical protein [Tanacetum cinerariifolium]